MCMCGGYKNRGKIYKFIVSHNLHLCFSCIVIPQRRGEKGVGGGAVGTTPTTRTHSVHISLSVGKNITGLRSEVQVNREWFALNPSSCWRSSLGTGIQGKTFRYHFALLNAALVVRINI